jgi:hypothetical protein
MSSPSARFLGEIQCRVLQDFGDDRFLADVALADMLDRDPCFSGQRCRRLPHPVAQRRGKVRIVEDADPVGVEEPRHPLGVADGGQRPGHNNPVVAGQNAGNPVVVAFTSALAIAPSAFVAPDDDATALLVPVHPA